MVVNFYIVNCLIFILSSHILNSDFGTFRMTLDVDMFCTKLYISMHSIFLVDNFFGLGYFRCPYIFLKSSHIYFKVPRYNLRGHTTIGPADKYGFPCVNAVVDEPSTYEEVCSIPEWQLAMCEELCCA